MRELRAKRFPANSMETNAVYKMSWTLMAQAGHIKFSSDDENESKTCSSNDDVNQMNKNRSCRREEDYN